MIETKKSTHLWLFAGVVFALLVLLVVFGGLAGKVLVQDPEGIPETANAVMESLHKGDWETLERLVTGNPPLAPETGEEDSAEQLIWKAYQQSLSWECEEGYDVQGEYVTLGIRVTCLDISGMVAAMAQTLQEPNGDPDGALLMAAQLALESETIPMERQITLTFVRENGQWQVLPNKALLSLLSGFTAK